MVLNDVGLDLITTFVLLLDYFDQMAMAGRSLLENGIRGTMRILVQESKRVVLVQIASHLLRNLISDIVHVSSPFGCAN
jgi:hypothetical protein